VQFSAQIAATRAVIGAATTADWSIAAPGIEAQHAEIAWDASQLWIRDNGSRAGTWIGAEKLTQDWRPLSAGEQIRLGQATIAVQLSGASAADDDDEFFEDAATQVTSDSSGKGGSIKRAPSSQREDEAESTMIVQTPAGDPMAASPRPGTMPPKLNTMPPKINVGVKPVAPVGGGASTLVTESNSDLQAYAMQMASQQNVGGFAQGGYPPSPYPQGQAPVGTPQGGYGDPNGFAQPNGFQQPNGYGMQPMGGEFAPPSSEMSAIFGSIPPPAMQTEKPKDKKLFEVLPPRTAAMLGVAIIAALGVAMWPPPEPPPARARPLPAELRAPQPTWQPPIPGQNAGASGAILLRASTAPPAPEPLPPGQRPPRNAPPPPAQDTYPERQAVDLVAQNKIREAIVAYQNLQTAHPDQPVYRDILILLQRKLEEQACPPGSPQPCQANPSTAPQQR
jgi:predicted component of type VI protein secretion system